MRLLNGSTGCTLMSLFLMPSKPATDGLIGWLLAAGLVLALSSGTLWSMGTRPRNTQ